MKDFLTDEEMVSLESSVAVAETPDFISDAEAPSFFGEAPAPVAPAPEPKRPGLFSTATLKGETTYKAEEGGAGTILPNVARTFGNIPSSAAKITRAVAAPVNPLDLDSPMNIGRNLVESVKQTKDIFKDRGVKQGTKDIAGGFKDVFKKGYNVWRDIGEGIYGNLERNVLSEDSVTKGVGVSAAQATSEVAKLGIEDPLLLPTLVGSKNISRLSSPVTRGADTSLDAVYRQAQQQAGKVQAARMERRVTAREKEIFDIENQYVKTRKSMDYSKDAHASSRRRIASTDVLVGSVDDSGKIRTNQPGGAVDQYEKMTIEGTEGVVRESLVREGASVKADVLEARLKANIERNPLIKGKAKEAAMRNVEQEVANYGRDTSGNIPLVEVHDAKIATTKIVKDFATPAEYKTYQKALGNGLKSTVEDFSSVNVGEINAELSKYYEDLELLASLDGKLVRGGKLGKYFAGTGGAIVGTVAGSIVGGPVGAIVGGSVTSMVATKLKGAAMSRTLGKATGYVPPPNPVLEAAKVQAKSPRLMLPAPQAEATPPLFVTPRGKATPLFQEATDVSAVEAGRAKTSADFRRVKKAPDIVPNVPERELPVIEAGAKPKAKGVEIDKLGAPKVFAPEIKRKPLVPKGKGEVEVTLTTGKPLVPKGKGDGSELLERVRQAGTKLTNDLKEETLAGRREGARLSTVEKIDNLDVFPKGTKPGDTVTIYRAGSGNIKPGDQVTVVVENAKRYLPLRPNSKLVKGRARVEDLVRNEGLVSEFIYAPKK